MSHPSREQYLESKVLTASQPQLHVMLLDGALRFGGQAQTMWSEGSEFAEVDPMLERMSNIVDELTHGTSTAKEEISQQLEQQYAFVYRELAACRINQEPELLTSCLELLTFQRETWRLASELLETEKAAPSRKAMPVMPQMPHMKSSGLTPTTSGFSLEA